MSSIQTGIELNDGFTGILNSIIGSVNLAVSAMEDMNGAMGADMDISSLEGARAEINQATMAVNELERAMSQLAAPVVDGPQMTRPDVIPNALPEPVSVPVEWRADGLDVFTGSGIERFWQEVQSADAMLQRLCATQDAIAKQAYDTGIFPPEAFQNLNSMAVRFDDIRDRIRQIGSDPLNMGTDAANSEMERLRAQLDQAVAEQNELNAAMDAMDVSAANDAYLRLSRTVGSTEQYLRDNVDEQGRFNREISRGVGAAGNLRSVIASAVGAFVGMAGVRKAIGWIEECTEAFDTQRNAELQLMSVLANTIEAEVTADTSEAVGEINGIQDQVDGVTVAASADTQALAAAFDAITAKASEIQSRGIYGDEAMIAGAAEFSTYFSDTAAIEMMMDTLADYAMGMTGGGGLDVAAMVDYATGLGKIMSGSYDAMTKKGFEFTEAQKAVIEGTASQEQIIAAIGEEYLDASQDVQAAAAINAVIAESWDGLYESMSNTPEGKIIQMTNTFGDMKEVVGGQLYPYVILFVDAITGHWDTIQAGLDGVTRGLQFMMGVLSWLLEGALDFAQAVMDNWSWISPVIYGIVGALAVYGTYLAITKGLELASAAAKGIMAVWEGIHAAAIWATTGATWAEVTAQNGLNSAMYACPIVWIIVLIIALVALFYAVVAAVNKFAGTSVSATGIICGVFMVAAAFIGNLFITLINFVIDVFVVLWNFIAAFANFFANVFTDPVGAIARLFFDLVDCILGLLESLASAIDTIFGSNLAGAVSGWRDSLGGWVDETFGQGKEIMAKMDASSLHLERFEYGAAYDAGYSFGKGIDESIASFDPAALFGTEQMPTMDDYASSFGDAMADNGMAGDVGDIAGNTGSIRDSLDCTEEDLKYLRDIAEQEAVNRYTLAEVKVDMSGMQNNINSGDDIDGFMTKLTDSVNEAVDNMTEGVHA